MEENEFKYTIYKKNVWLELLYKGVAMNSKIVYKGANKKDCERWIKENAKKN